MFSYNSIIRHEKCLINLCNISGEPIVKENIRHVVKTCKMRLDVKTDKGVEALLP